MKKEIFEKGDRIKVKQDSSSYYFIANYMSEKNRKKWDGTGIVIGQSSSTNVNIWIRVEDFVESMGIYPSNCILIKEWIDTIPDEMWIIK